MLNVFLATETADGALFRKYGERIARDAGMSFDSEAERQRVFDDLCHIAGSFMQQKDLSK